MRLTYITWGYEHDAPIIRAFQEMGVEIHKTEINGDELPDYEKVEQNLKDAVEEIVFSVNFHSTVSEFCQKKRIPYCTWVLQLPNYDLYTENVKNACNYIGICDSYLVEKMWNIGVEKVFFLPDAIEKVTEEKTDPKYRGVCFISKQPESKLQTEGMSLYNKGYLEAFLHAQRVLLGDYILENGLIDRVQQAAFQANPTAENILPEFGKLYLADQYLAPTCTILQQNIFMQNYDSVMTIYSNGEFQNCKCEKYPYLQNEEKEQIYREREFTVVMAPHILHNAIPRQMLEVIAAGGFPLCAMQKDYSYFFKENENIACFHNISEFQDLLVRYGNNVEERNRLLENTVNTIQNSHTYQKRIEFILDTWSKL